MIMIVTGRYIRAIVYINFLNTPTGTSRQNARDIPAKTHFLPRVSRDRRNFLTLTAQKCLAGIGTLFDFDMFV